MKDIGRHNYLERFLEFHEGLLNSSERQELNAFLLSNPQYQEEFDALADCYLVNEEAPAFPGKTKLKKSDELELKLKAPSIVYPLKSELKVEADQALPVFMGEKLKALDSSLQLRANPALKYPGAKQLKKTPAKVIPFYYGWKSAIAVAASVLIVWMLWPNNIPTGDLGNWISSTESLSKKARVQEFTQSDLGFGQEEASSTVQTKPSNIAGINPSNSTNGSSTSKRERFNSIPSISVSNLIGATADRLAVGIENSEVESMISSTEYFANASPASSSSRAYISLPVYAKNQLYKSLVEEEDPKEGLLLALLDRTVDKISENTDIEMDLDVKKEKGKKLDHFRFTIGRLEIIK